MAQVRALVRKLVLEELLSSEVLEVRVIDPPFAHAFVGQAVHMLEQKKPDHKPCCNSRPTTVPVQRRDLAVELCAKVGDGMKGLGGVSWGVFEPPLLQRRSDTP